MNKETLEGSVVDGEWECDECGQIIPGRASKPPVGSCPDCGEPTDNSFTFFPHDDDWDDGWDDDSEDSEE